MDWLWAALRALVYGAAAAIAIHPGNTSAQQSDSPGKPTARGEVQPPFYPVDAIVLGYEPSADLPALEGFAITLGRDAQVLVARERGASAVTLALRDIGKRGSASLAPDALEAICRQLADGLQAQGIERAWVRPDPRDVDPTTNRDLRAESNRALRLQVGVGETRGFEKSAPVAPAPTRTAQTPAATRYPVSAVQLEYGRENPALPRLEELATLEIPFSVVDGGLSIPGESNESVSAKLAQLGALGMPLTRKGIVSLSAQIVREFNERGFAGVRVHPDVADIEPGSGRDLRPPGQTVLRMKVWSGRVAEIRTFASGERVPSERAMNNPVHAALKARSPLQPGPLEKGGGSLIRIDQLEGYVARLNRHPGRHVDAALSPALTPGGAYIDYVITETRPWSVSVMAGDTGTERTHAYRQRLSFAHTQLTNHDDVLQLDYVTDGFDGLYAAAVSYELPWFRSDRLRWRFFGSKSAYDIDFDGREFGSPEFRFTVQGDSWEAGTQLIANVFQSGKLFVDLVAGARYEVAHVDNEGGAVEGRDAFLLPSVGLRLERQSDFSRLFVTTELERNLARWAGTDAQSVDARGAFDGAGGLGRLSPADDFSVLHWDASFSAFLEPLFDRAAYAVPNAPRGSLAHELVLRLFGQYAFGHRLIAQEQMAAGGVNTVRGYAQAAAVGDSVYGASLEYRFHMPRVLGIRRPVQLPFLGGFRVGPEVPGGRPDWDLIFRLFADAARVQTSSREFFESNQQLLGVGFGLELQLRRNFAARLDVGWPLEPGTRSIRGVDLAQRGEPELHFTITTLY